MAATMTEATDNDNNNDNNNPIKTMAETTATLMHPTIFKSNISKCDRIGGKHRELNRTGPLLNANTSRLVPRDQGACPGPQSCMHPGHFSTEKLRHKVNGLIILPKRDKSRLWATALLKAVNVLKREICAFVYGHRV